VLKDGDMVTDYTFKAIIIGDAGVGKSCILHRAVNNEFKEEYDVTIGAEFSSIITKIKGKTIKLQVWDTAGQENFRSMIRVFYKGSHAAFLVYDLTNKESFDKLHDWVMDVRENALPDVRLMLVGNQKDKEDKRQVSADASNKFFKEMNFVGFKETSAKSGEGVLEMFVDMAKRLYLELGDSSTPGGPKGGKISSKSTKSGKKGCC